MKPHEEWIFKAEQDLRSAELLYAAADPVLDVAIYHAHQCAEKSLKSYLSLKQCTIDKTHNLDLLGRRCEEMYSSFIQIREELVFLMPFATAYRYPEGELLPSREKTLKAVCSARLVFDFVSALVRQEDD
ncbi:MAG TPA: HEPN domain-containing protein [Spirochaetota bacterium]|nr:HEPN domain-containing protein [Spirochaetota bacterium]HPH04163.1 HEPN domain-containing protein [Spirochaetota bacterium]